MYAIRSYYDSCLCSGTGKSNEVFRANIGSENSCANDIPRLTFSEQVVLAVGAFRITSYNVCYTKLLRFQRWDPDKLLAFHQTSNPIQTTTFTSINQLISDPRTAKYTITLAMNISNLAG